MQDQLAGADCVELNALPAAFCMFLSVSGLLLAVERLYATMNYAKYEYENFTRVIERIFLVMVRPREGRQFQ